MWSNLKQPKPIRNEKFLNEIRRRKCVICQKFGEVQATMTTAHHVIHDRNSGGKTCDMRAIPLCDGHHQGMWDTTKVAIHKEKKKWRELYGADWSYSD
jgi:hypothetical protein